MNPVELPLFRNFTMTIGPNEFAFRDWRTLSADSRLRIQDAQHDMIVNRTPRDLLCQSGEQRALEKERVAVITHDDPAAGEAERLRLAEINPARNTRNFARGDFNPITFGVRRNGNFFGAWQWYGIHRISETPQRLRVRGGWFPAYKRDLTLKEIAERSIDMVEGFLTQRMMMENGQLFDLVVGTAPFLDDGTPGTRIIQEMLLDLPNHTEIDVTTIDKGGFQTGRTAIELRKKAP